MRFFDEFHFKILLLKYCDVVSVVRGDQKQMSKYDKPRNYSYRKRKINDVACCIAVSREKSYKFLF